MKKNLAVLLAFICLITSVSCGAATEKADRVIYGNIYTSDENNKYAEALASKDGVFIYVGDKDGVKKYIGKDTVIETYDNGELVTAGLVDGHTHVNQLMGAKIADLCELEAESDKDSILQQIKAFVEAHPDLDFYIVNGWDASAFLDEPYKIPTWHLLEGITDKPMLCSSSDGHTYWVNKALLDLSGVTKDTPNPEGGDIAKDPVTGEPLGQFTDTAQNYISKVKPDYDASVYQQAALASDELCLEQGYVTRFQALDNEKVDPFKYPYITYVEAMDKEDKLICYEQASFVVTNSDNYLEQVDEAIRLRDETAGGNFEVTTVKFFIDGIIENAGAYLMDPYTYWPDDPWYGTPLWEGEEAVKHMGEAVAKANEAGMTCHFHCMGDQAVHDVLDAIEYAASLIGKDKVRECRNAVAHLALVNEADFDRFADLGMVAVLNPWCSKDPKYYVVQVALLGEERAFKQYPMQSFVKAGVHVSFGTDLGASFTYDSIECFHVIATRTFNNDDPESLLNPDEKLTREQTLDAMTIGGAYQMNKEDTFGSITVGKEASLCVFSKDLLTIPDTEIMSTEVLKVMVRGTWYVER